MSVTRRNQSHRFHRHARSIPVADRAGHTDEISSGAEHRDKGPLFEMCLMYNRGEEEGSVTTVSREGVGRLARGHGVSRQKSGCGGCGGGSLGVGREGVRGIPDIACQWGAGPSRGCIVAVTPDDRSAESGVAECLGEVGAEDSVVLPLPLWSSGRILSGRPRSNRGPKDGAPGMPFWPDSITLFYPSDSDP